MAMSAIVALKTVQYKLFYCTRLVSSVRFLQTFRPKTIPHRFHKLENHPKLLKIHPRYITLNASNWNESYHFINTNVSNDVIIWKYDSNKPTRNYRILAVLQSIFLFGSSYFFSSFLPSISNYTALKEYLMENSLILVLTVMPVITGCVGLAFIAFFLRRSIRYIILNKGGKEVTFVVSRLLKGMDQIVLPVTDTTIRSGRDETRSYMILKLKNRSFFYLCDSRGKFVNPLLFDNTVGSLRNT